MHRRSLHQQQHPKTAHPPTLEEPSDNKEHDPIVFVRTSAMLPRKTLPNAIVAILCGCMLLRSAPPSLYRQTPISNQQITTTVEDNYRKADTANDGGDSGLKKEEDVLNKDSTAREMPAQKEEQEPPAESAPIVPATTTPPIQQQSQFPQFLEDYIQWHDQTKFTPSAKYLIWRCGRGSGGTGDRLKGILTAFYTAVCTRRVLLIDWPLKEARDVSPFLAPHRIDWRLPDQMMPHLSNQPLPKYESIDNYNNPWFKELTIPTNQYDANIIDMRANLWSEHKNAVVRVNDTQCLQRLWHEEPKPNAYYMQDKFLFRMGFWSLFTFGNAVHNRKRQIQQEANLLEFSSRPGPVSQPQRRRRLSEGDKGDKLQNLRQQRRLQQQSSSSFAGQTTIQPYVAVHIRTGIGSTWSDPLRHGSDDDYQKFYRCAKKLQQGIYDKQRQQLSCSSTPRADYQKPLPLLPIYVAADNKLAKQALVRLDRQTTNSNQTVRVLETMDIYHIDRSAQAGNHAENTVWGELNVLLEAVCLVTSRSGFSDLATWLQPTPTGKRCAVMFNQCDDEVNVQKALDALDFGCSDNG